MQGKKESNPKERLGRSRLLLFETADSTNNVAKEFAKNGFHKEIPYPLDENESYVFVAEEQSAGRGRLGRSFSSEKGLGLYMSYLFPTAKTPPEGVSLTAYLALAVRDSIFALCGLDAKIKWVNDICYGGKKIGGILAEGAIRPDGTYEYAVAGIGVNLYKRDFRELSEIAASIEDFVPPPSAMELCREIEKRLSEFEKHSPRHFMAEYRRHSLVLGKEIKVSTPNGESFTAIAEDVLDGGELLVRREGELLTVRTADVSVRLCEK